MADLGLEKWVTRMEEVSGTRMIHQIDELMDHIGDYKVHLRTVLPEYIKKATQAIKLTREAYELRRYERSRASFGEGLPKN